MPVLMQHVHRQHSGAVRSASSLRVLAMIGQDAWGSQATGAPTAAGADDAPPQCSLTCERPMAAVLHVYLMQTVQMLRQCDLGGASSSRAMLTGQCCNPLAAAAEHTLWLHSWQQQQPRGKAHGTLSWCVDPIFSSASRKLSKVPWLKMRCCQRAYIDSSRSRSLACVTQQSQAQGPFTCLSLPENRETTYAPLANWPL